MVRRNFIKLISSVGAWGLLNKSLSFTTNWVFRQPPNLLDNSFKWLGEKSNRSGTYWASSPDDIMGEIITQKETFQTTRLRQKEIFLLLKSHHKEKNPHLLMSHLQKNLQQKNLHLRNLRQNRLQ